MPPRTAVFPHVRRGLGVVVAALLLGTAVSAPANADPGHRRPAASGSPSSPSASPGPALAQRLRAAVSTSQAAARRVEVLTGRTAVLAAREDRTGARVEQLYARAMSAEPAGALERLVDWVVGAESEVDLALAATEEHRVMQRRVEVAVAALTRARAAAEAAEAAWSRTLDDIATEERRAAAEAAAGSAIAQAQFAPAYRPRSRAQARRDRTALHAWEHYLTSLAEAGVTPPSASLLIDPEKLPDPLRPVTDEAGRASPGVAQVPRRGGRPLVVLPRETVRAVSAAFARIGRSTKASAADAYACGGLASRAWARAADPLPETSTAQWERLGSVAGKDLQPGDLVYLGDEVRGLHQAGVYVGGGRLILADTDDGEAGVQPMPSSGVYGVKRPVLPGPERRDTAPAPDGVVTGCGEVAVPEAPAPAVVPSAAAIPPYAPPPTVSAPVHDPSVPDLWLPDLLSPGGPLAARGFAGAAGWPLGSGGVPAWRNTWTSPVADGSRLSSRFGQEGSLWSSGRHTGQDFAAPTGTPVLAARGGVVTVEAPAWAGNLVRIDHGDGFESWYAHLSQVLVRSGQTVTAGQPVGAVGSEGNSTGPHLHFEIRRNGVPVDPMTLLP